MALIDAEVWLSCRTLENNNITGGLSSAWGAPGVFQSLVEIDLSQNWGLNGILLSQWGGPGAFPQLQVSKPDASPVRLVICVHSRCAKWSAEMNLQCLYDLSGRMQLSRLAFARDLRTCGWLQTLNLSNTGLSGELPALWGVNGSLPSLTLLDVSRNGVSGISLLPSSGFVQSMHADKFAM